MKTNYCMAAIIVAIIFSAAYLYTNRFSISTTEKIAYVYDKFNGEMQIFTLNGKKNLTDNTAKIDGEYEKAKKKVSVKIAYMGDRCTEDYPLDVRISNESDRKILYSSFNLDIREKGSSTSLINDGTLSFPKLVQDGIVEPGYTLSVCYKMPKISKKFDKEKMEVVIYGAEYTFWGIPKGNMDVLMRFDAFK